MRREFLLEKITARYMLWVLSTQFYQTIRGNFFSSPHIDLRLGKSHVLPNIKCKRLKMLLDGGLNGSSSIIIE